MLGICKLFWNLTKYGTLVISASTTDSFKNKLDKLWSNQALIYDHKAELTGIGNRSFIRILIDNILYV